MFDPFSLAAGAGILAVGFLTGRLRRRKAAPPPAAINQAVCGCGHPRALHDEGGSLCSAEVERPHYLSYGARSGKEWVPCPCRQYDGPKPFEELYPAPILPTVD